MPAPQTPPIGLHLAAAARTVSRAFDDALGEAGGSMPVWLVLLNLKIRGQVANQRELAAAVGIREATLTHHLNAMESDGLLTRRRDPANRRVHLVEVTEAGETAFARLRDAALAFDRRLRRGVSAEELSAFEDVLSRLAGNVAPAGTGGETAGEGGAARTT
jgi:MarR family transcriptional regulator for hemolysin